MFLTPSTILICDILHKARDMALNDGRIYSLERMRVRSTHGKRVDALGICKRVIVRHSCSVCFANVDGDQNTLKNVKILQLNFSKVLETATALLEVMSRDTCDEFSTVVRGSPEAN